MSVTINLSFIREILLVCLLLLTVCILNIFFFFHPLIFASIYSNTTVSDQLWSPGEQLRQAQIIRTQLISSQSFDEKNLLEQRVVLTNEEVKHMNDVQIVLRTTKYVLFCYVFLVVLICLWLFQKTNYTTLNIQKLLSHLILIYTAIATLFLVLVVTIWSQLFTLFHEVFFPKGNWSFPSDATLIRLFPDTFWEKSFILVTVLPLCELILLWLIVKAVQAWFSRHDAILSK